MDNRYRSGFISVPEGRIKYCVQHGDASGIPVILVSGGPCGNFSMLRRTVGKYAGNHPMISYTQMNSPESEPLSRKDSSYWTLEYYTREIGRVMESLGIGRAVFFGHSWGGALALNYASMAPDRCAGVIAASPLIDTRAWISDTQVRLREIKPDVDAFMREAGRAGLSPEDAPYLRAKAETALFAARYQNRLYSPNLYLELLLKNSPDSVPSPGREVYLGMWGPNEYEVCGTLRDLDISCLLPGLRVPVLFVCGESDEVLPETLRGFSAMVPDSEFYIVKGASHCFMEDACSEEKAKFLAKISEWADGIGRENAVPAVCSHDGPADIS